MDVIYGLFLDFLSTISQTDNRDLPNLFIIFTLNTWDAGSFFGEFCLLDNIYEAVCEAVLWFTISALDVLCVVQTQ